MADRPQKERVPFCHCEFSESALSRHLETCRQRTTVEPSYEQRYPGSDPQLNYCFSWPNKRFC
jgi:hypothetical protein